jgi:hypothetical protein
MQMHDKCSVRRQMVWIDDARATQQPTVSLFENLPGKGRSESAGGRATMKVLTNERQN